MSTRQVVLNLARVVIAAAWADGEISHEEINSLKERLLNLRAAGFARGLELTGQDWARLEMYMEAPVDAAERARLVANLQNSLRTREQKQVAIDALRAVMLADGEISAEEQVVLAEIEAAINEVSVGLVGAMEWLVGSDARKRRTAVAGAPNRERFFDDFLRNKVYYSLAHHLKQEEVELALSEPEQRKLGLVGGLMAKVAHVDGELTDEEFQSMVGTVQRYWQLNDTAAALVAEVALAAINQNYEPTRIMKELANSTENQERREILTALFAIAAADGNISADEHEEIRVIARGINLTHEDFINAKLRVLGKE